MTDETEPERRTIHVFDIDLETGEVPVRELRVVDARDASARRYSILTMDFGPALKKLDDAEKSGGRES